MDTVARRMLMGVVLFLLATVGASAQPASGAPAASAQAPAPADDDALYGTAKQLFDQYAPPEIKAQYDFPTPQEFDQVMNRLQDAIDRGSFQDMAAYEPQAKAILATIRTMPEYSDLADWLGARLDELDEARQIEAASAPSVPPAPAQGPAPAPGAPPPRINAASAEEAAIPYYNRWLGRLRDRPEPANAGELMPELRRAFAEEGVPPELAWLAEVESSLNPTARSPSGARGLFQLKAETARGLGLSTFLPDERTDPAKAAHAAARDLRELGKRFGSWPLAIAAYNAGAGRVSRALTERHADDYAGAASALPAGTRLYVPEVCALVAVRTGVTPDRLPPPQ